MIKKPEKIKELRELTERGIMECPKCGEEMTGELVKEPNWIEYVCECGYKVGN